MTREEAIAYGKRVIDLGLNDETQAFCEVVIKALEQEPCDDCISRQAVEEMIKAEFPERGMWEIEGDTEKETVCEVCVDLMQKLSELPSVTPQPKIGHWVKIGPYPMQTHEYACSKCGHETHDNTENYCSDCGARMVEPEESEDKE